MVKKDIDTNALKVTDIYRSGPRTKIKNPDWDFLVYELKKHIKYARNARIMTNFHRILLKVGAKHSPSLLQFCGSSD